MVEGNKIADQAAKVGAEEGSEVGVTTLEGIAQWGSSIREEERGRTDLGKGRLMDQPRKTVTNYTKCRI